MVTKLKKMNHSAPRPVGSVAVVKNNNNNKDNIYNFNAIDLTAS